MKTLITIAIASWYGCQFHGKVTASGEVFNMYEMTTAATKDYDLGDTLVVTNTDNGKSVTVTVTDRGAFEKYGRTLDLSRAAFDHIADTNRGLIRVKIERL